MNISTPQPARSCRAAARTVLLVDDHPLFRWGLASVLAQTGGRVAVHEAGSMLAALDSLALHPAYDLILYGWHLPDGGGLRGLMALCKRAPGVPVVVISGDGDEAIGVAARTVGASGYLSKAAEPATIRRVLASLLGFRPATAVARSTTTLGAAAAVVLTHRQREVLHQMAQGHANKRIASRLGIAEATVRAHVTDVLRALGAANRTAAVIKGSRLGLVEPDRRPRARY